MIIETDRKRQQLIDNLDQAHRSRTYGGDGGTLYGDAANEIRHLLTYIEQLRERLHWVNEDFLRMRQEMQLSQKAGSRE